MSTRSASVVPADAAQARQIVRNWRQHYCSGGIDQILTELFSPLTLRQRISARVNGKAVRFEPSWFAQGDVVLVFHRPDCQSLHAAFFNQRTGQFLPAIAVLSMTDRGKLGGGRRRDREAFLAGLIQSARSTRVAVGA